ncbi:hypothetical protein GFC29_3843 (plasmid) [Anoxybacillus sp. B7M1]|uniref:hypothetical protein n=1 Tax=Anoxybacillus sp. B7M1 TaxID=1490057 RepID=UPI0005CCDBE9|nr:hypothetical protein [Anoxybacillus sp. B7M1]ANB66131.1 hypothetical protein GFC29_3843 [Anoxybacillus sp. B7M1]
MKTENILNLVEALKELDPELLAKSIRDGVLYLDELLHGLCDSGKIPVALYRDFLSIRKKEQSAS